MSKLHSTRETIRAKGLRPTKRRVAILDTMARLQKPITAEEVHRRVKGVDLVTVYRTLESFRVVGLVREVRFKDATRRFEIQEVGHHHHVVCTTCGLVDELSHCDLVLEVSALKHTRRFAHIDEHSLEFFGTCVSCAKR